MWKELEDHVASWDTEKRRTKTLSTKIWQVTQSNATQAENLENDFKERATTNVGWKRLVTVIHKNFCLRTEPEDKGACEGLSDPTRAGCFSFGCWSARTSCAQGVVLEKCSSL